MEILFGMKVLNRDGKETGMTTGGTRVCRMEGCTGRRIVVRWPDGKITYPCLKGMKSLPNGSLQIL